MEGIKRIKKLSQETKDSSLKKVADYLITREDMNNRYLNQDKDLNKMWKYIVDKARTQAVDGAAYIDDEEVYGWAIHYWDEPEEDLKKENKTAKKTTKSKAEKEASSEKENKETVDKTVEKEQESVQNENDIIFKWKGKDVTRAQFNSKEYLSW